MSYSFPAISNQIFLDDELVTAPLYDGIILPGVTRDSILHLGRQMNDVKVTERYVQIGEVRRAIKEERVGSASFIKRNKNLNLYFFLVAFMHNIISQLKAKVIGRF